jgi:hypothetical protein
MFNPFKSSSNKTELEVARTEALTALAAEEAGTPEYKRIAADVEMLSKLIEAERPKPEKLSPNTIAVVAGNAGIAALVLWFERDNVMSTKLFPFMAKPKS